MTLCSSHSWRVGVLFAALCAVLLLLELPVKAQGWDDDDEPPAVRARERVNQLKKARLIEILNLDEASAEKFFVKYNQAQRAIDSAQQALQQSIDKLQRAIRQQKKAKIKELTDESLKRHTELQNAISSMLADMRPLLDEEQYAKFIVFESRFQQEMRRRLMEIKRNGRKKRGGFDEDEE